MPGTRLGKQIHLFACPAWLLLLQISPATPFALTLLRQPSKATTAVKGGARSSAIFWNQGWTESKVRGCPNAHPIVKLTRTHLSATMCSLEAEALKNMPRRELQTLAKTMGVRANSKSSAIISELLRKGKEETLAGSPSNEPEGNNEQAASSAQLTPDELRNTLNRTSTDGVLSLLSSHMSSQHLPCNEAAWHKLIAAASDGATGKMASLYNCALSVLSESNPNLCVEVYGGMQCEPDTVSASLAATACFLAGNEVAGDGILDRAVERASAARKAAGTERQLKKRQRILQQSLKTRKGASLSLGAHPLETAVGGDGGALRVLYEDAGVVAFCKPSGVLVHPTTSTALKGPGSVTVCDGLISAYGKDNVSWLGEYPGVVHRLDRGTSGVMLMAKNDRAHALLVAAFFGRRVQKTYHALVAGVPEWGLEGTAAESEVDGMWARSRIGTLEAFGKAGASLVEVRPEQGRKHQVRVHLEGQGHPLFLDPLYGDCRATGHTSRRKAKKSAGGRGRGRGQGSGAVPAAVQQAGERWKDGRFFLHSAEVSLPAWVKGDARAAGERREEGAEALVLAAERPAWFEEVVQALREE